MTALSAAFGDINNDGFVDLFVTAEGHLGFGFGPPAEQHEDRLYLNNGNLTFTDISASAGVLGGLGSCVASFSHFDDDGFIDLFVGVDADRLDHPVARSGKGVFHFHGFHDDQRIAALD